MSSIKENVKLVLLEYMTQKYAIAHGKPENGQKIGRDQPL